MPIVAGSHFLDKFRMSDFDTRFSGRILDYTFRHLQTNINLYASKK
jgi:hypothetical protein